MTRNELKIVLNQQAKTLTINASMLKDQSNRTLLYGYTCDRLNWHVYLYYGSICLYIYDYPNKTVRFEEKENWEPDDLIPDKRLHPEMCDFEFCLLLAKYGVTCFHFTTYADNGEKCPKFGKY